MHQLDVLFSLVLFSSFHSLVYILMSHWVKRDDGKGLLKLVFLHAYFVFQKFDLRTVNILGRQHIPGLISVMAAGNIFE